MSSDLSIARNKQERKSEFLYYEKSEADKKQESFLDNENHFSCSTPIKFDDQENVNENREEQESGLYEKSLKMMEKLNASNDEVNVYNSSLLEFEEIEKKANCQVKNDSIASSHNGKNVLNEPIDEMQDLIRKIEEANGFNVLALKSNNDHSAQIKLIESENMFYDNLLNLNDEKNIKLKEDGGEENFMSSSFLSQNEHIKTLQNCLEQEICKRQQCEKQLKDMYQTVVDLQQKLALANGLDRKRQMFGKNVDLALRKVRALSFRLFKALRFKKIAFYLLKILENWKKKESECQSIIIKLNNQIKRAHENEQKAIVVSVNLIRYETLKSF